MMNKLNNIQNIKVGNIYFSNFQNINLKIDKNDKKNSEEKNFLYQKNITPKNDNNNYLDIILKLAQNNQNYFLNGNINNYYNNNIETKKFDNEKNNIIINCKNSDINNNKNFCNFGNFNIIESTDINNYNNIINQNQNNYIINNINNINNINFISDSNKLKLNISNIIDKKKNIIYLNNNNNNLINNNNYFQKKNYINNVIDNDIINYINNIQIKDFIKYIKNLPAPLIDYLCTPKGNLIIEKKLRKINNNESKIFLIKLLNAEGLTILMKNINGNYFFQQFIKGLEQNIISLIISSISKDFIDISKNDYGTFSIQSLLNEVSSLKNEQQILNIIKNYEIEMAFDKNATYVLQKIILLFPDIHRIYLNEIIIKNFKDLCLDSNGICLIKNFIKTNTLINDKKRINEEIIKNFVILAESPFGNYGIQFIMEIWNKNELNDIKMKIYENIYKFSIHQFSSNVVEKAFEIFDDENKEKMIRKLCFEKYFIILLKNKFGRFVLDKAIYYMNFKIRNEFIIYLFNNINDNTYSLKDRNKIKKLIKKINNNILKNHFEELSRNYKIENIGNNIFNYAFKNNSTNNYNKKNIFL